MNILVLNCGSSSVKFQLIHTNDELILNNSDYSLASGVVERVGSEALLTFRSISSSGEVLKTLRTTAPVRTHQDAIDLVIKWIISSESHIEGVSSLADIQAVGHRVVHGGEKLTKSVLIDDDVIEQIEDCIEIAPLHNPQNLKGIYAARHSFGHGVPQVAVFDTAFHHTLPEQSYLYAIPYQFYRRHRIRRYGFHGLSHRYVSFRYRTMLDLERENVNIISLHLGNGCSACAIKGGNSVDTSMGMTPLEGLVMGSRSGDIDPAILSFLAHKEGYSVDDIDRILNSQSGLLGISGLTNDMRDLIAEARENDDRRAKLAIDIFSYRIKKYIGAYLAALNGVDSIVFTGGVGENADYIRSKICAGMNWLGLELDEELNKKVIRGREAKISSEGSKVNVWVIPTNEELLIARDTYRCVTNKE